MIRCVEGEVPVNSPPPLVSTWTLSLFVATPLSVLPKTTSLSSSELSSISPSRSGGVILPALTRAAIAAEASLVHVGVKRKLGG